MVDQGKPISDLPIKKTASIADRILFIYNASNTAAQYAATMSLEDLFVLAGAGIQDAPNDDKFYVRRNGAWIQLPSGYSLVFEYNFDNTVIPPPANSQLRLNNTVSASATKIWLHNNNFDGADVSNLLAQVVKDFIIFVQDKDDPTRYARYHANGPATNLGSYSEIPVTYINGSAALNNNQRIIVLIYGGG
jgi:hypothetical protein